VWFQSRKRLQQATAEKEAEMAALKSAKELVRTVVEERDRLRVIEQLMLTNKARESEELEAKRAASKHIMARLHADSQQLQEEVQSARLQAYLADKQASTDIQREEELLEETMQAAVAMEVRMLLLLLLNDRVVFLCCEC
jgi:hypothetical protein